jgi:hypothetical protein
MAPNHLWPNAGSRGAKSFGDPENAVMIKKLISMLLSVTIVGGMALAFNTGTLGASGAVNSDTSHLSATTQPSLAAEFAEPPASAVTPAVQGEVAAVPQAPAIAVPAPQTKAAARRGNEPSGVVAFRANSPRRHLTRSCSARPSPRSWHLRHRRPPARPMRQKRPFHRASSPGRL